MGHIGSIIVPGAKLGLGYTEKLLADVTPDTYARFTRPGGVVVKSNHPAFVLGRQVQPWCSQTGSYRLRDSEILKGTIKITVCCKHEGTKTMEVR